MGRKCGISECASDSSRPEDMGVTFHKIPMHPDIRPKWMQLCRIPEDKQMMKVVYICSRHFLRADFCNFKGKKYMLKQGVLPSVFPWNKTKLQWKRLGEELSLNTPLPPNVKIEAKEPFIIKSEYEDQPNDSSPVLNIKKEPASPEIKQESNVQNSSSTIEEQKVISVNTPTGRITFTPDERIEALDFNQRWCPAKIVEVDYQENEVLVHFEQYSNKYDEWICMNSNALRAIQKEAIVSVVPNVAEVKKSLSESFAVGERCMASWSDSRKFPATISRILDADTYEVLFDDGFVKVLKGHRIAKTQGKLMQASPLFDPSSCSKQERRDRKRKINIPALFKKKPRTSSQEDKGPAHGGEGVLSPSEDMEFWSPKWENGRPIGEDSAIETSDGMRKSVVVADPRLPAKWTKHLVQRTHGTSAGKWDTVIVNPDGRRFRTRSEIKTFVEENSHLKLTEAMFDFSLYRRSRKHHDVSKKTPQTPLELPPVSEPVHAIPEPEEEEGTGQHSLKILVVDNSYKCPIEGCGKNFRRENLAQMHVKHYHPEYTKYLDSTPNVADLAYARTVGESLDRSPGPEKSNRVPTVRQIQKASTPKVSTPKYPQSPSLDLEHKTPLAPKKDQEIIKLLSKPVEGMKHDETLQALPSGLPHSAYPDIKLKDLLSKGEPIPKRDELGPRTRPPGSGIKTLLPVIREPKPVEEVDMLKTSKHKRKRNISEQIEAMKVKEEPVPRQTVSEQPNNVIIEGGEVIKIVRMKREEIINCTCGITEEDGLMIQCELCLCWQHAYCNNIERENQVPEKYVCYICQNPMRQRSSKKYFHDQDWLKHGTLPVGSYHCKDEEILQKRFEKLKKSHDLSGGLVELKNFLHTMNVKIKIAEAKNHPKLYLWSKPWDKPLLPEKEEKKDYTKVEDIKTEEQHSDSLLFSILKTGKEEHKLKDELTEFPKIDINALMDNNLEQLPAAPIVPQPEAAIESEDCRINLLEHISHYQSLIEERLEDFEKQINILDTGPVIDEDVENFPRIRHTTEMIMRDLNSLNEFAHLTTF